MRHHPCCLDSRKTFVAENKPFDVLREGAVTHSVENVGGSDARAYMVEMKSAGPKSKA